MGEHWMWLVRAGLRAAAHNSRTVPSRAAALTALESASRPACLSCSACSTDLQVSDCPSTSSRGDARASTPGRRSQPTAAPAGAGLWQRVRSHGQGAAASLPSSVRALHTGAGARAPAAGGGAGSEEQPPQQVPQGDEGPVQNPLQAALEAAAAARTAPVEAADGEEGAAPGAQGARAGGRGARQHRTWVWFDEKDEREERRKELKRETYDSAGTAYLLDVPQSMKKMDRIVRLVRGLSYPEAVAQCTLVPHKAAKYVLQALEHAHEDAVRDKKLAAERLVVDTIFVTKGLYQKGMRPMGKGNVGSNTVRKSHLRVVLEEVGELPAASARVVPPLMSAWLPRRAALEGALGKGAGAGSWAPPRPRFAYRTEV